MIQHLNIYIKIKILDLKIANLKLRDKDNNLGREEIESYEIYLPNFKEICYLNINKEDASLSLFTCTSYEETRNKTNNPEDLKIIEELERLSMDDDFIFDYHCDNDEKLTKISLYDDGLEEGINQGISQRNIEIAKNMLSKWLDINTISECTNLSSEEITKFKEEV